MEDRSGGEQEPFHQRSADDDDHERAPLGQRTGNGGAHELTDPQGAHDQPCGRVTGTQ